MYFARCHERTGAEKRLYEEGEGAGEGILLRELINRLLRSIAINKAVNTWRDPSSLQLTGGMK